jgi:hypothetical protein
MKPLILAAGLTLLFGCSRSELMIHEQLAVLDEFRASAWGGCRFSFNEGSFEQGPRKDRRYWQCKGQTSPGQPYTITLVEREPESGRAGELVLEYRLDGSSGFLGLTGPLFKMAGLRSKEEIDKGRAAIQALTNRIDESFETQGDFDRFVMRVASGRPRPGMATVHIEFE